MTLKRILIYWYLRIKSLWENVKDESEEVDKEEEKLGKKDKKLGTVRYLNDKEGLLPIKSDDTFFICL